MTEPDEPTLKLILSHFQELDASLDKLSHQEEGRIVGLPPWALSHRRIDVGKVHNAQDTNVYVVKVMPDEQLDQDVINLIELTSQAEINQFGAPHWPDIRVNPNHKGVQFDFGPLELIEAHNVNAIPVFLFPGRFIVLSGDALAEEFSQFQAKQQAFDLWNNAKHRLGDNGSFVYNLQQIFSRLRHIIKRKGWVERRIHRYLYQYRNFLLPFDFEQCFSEHRLVLNGETGEDRVADLILKRPAGQPALLIELEPPNLRLFRRNKEYTAEANHAKNQIAQWVSYIERNPENVKGEMGFLSGPKQRLVVIGKGLENREEMEATRFTDTLMWTYDLLIETAKERLNRQIADQCALLGIANPNFI